MLIIIRPAAVSFTVSYRLNDGGGQLPVTQSILFIVNAATAQQSCST